MEYVPIDPRELYAIAETDPDLWDLLPGSELSHYIFGSGTLTEIRRHPRETPTVYVLFRGESNVRRFVAESLADGKFTAAFVPPEAAQKISQLRSALEAQLAQRRLEAEAEADFAQLKQKYHLLEFEPTGPVTRLYKILLQLEGGERLAVSDIGWLIGHNLHAPVAIFYENRAARSKDPWDSVLASSHWRNAGFPSRAISATAHVTASDRRARSALLTTRGGALRDLGDLSAAERCALDAIRLTPKSFYPFNLMGAIKYQAGLPSEGDKYFSRARELGSAESDQVIQIKSALEKAHQPEQVVVATYLLRKDPKKFDWARRYM